jgi:replicative DNA helicase
LANKEPKPNTDEHAKWLSDMHAAHGKADLIIGKQRHGPTGTVQVHFDAEVTRFDNLAHDHQLPNRFGDG